MILTEAPILSKLNSCRVDLNDLPSGCQERPITFGNSGRLGLNFNILVTTRLIVLIIKYFPTSSVGSEINHLIDYEL